MQIFVLSNSNTEFHTSFIKYCLINNSTILMIFYINPNTHTQQQLQQQLQQQQKQDESSSVKNGIYISHF